MADETVPAAPDSWMTDVQRALALVLVGTLAFSLVAVIIRLVIWGDVPALVDLMKTLVSALINMVMLVLGYFYGSSKAKEASDSSQQKIVEKLTSSAPPGTGPVAPLPPPVVVVAWWSLLTDSERAEIASGATSDPRAAAFMSAAQTGRASPDDLAYLVTAGLLTQGRATAIQSA